MAQAGNANSLAYGMDSVQPAARNTASAPQLMEALLLVSAALPALEAHLYYPQCHTALMPHLYHRTSLTERLRSTCNPLVVILSMCADSSTVTREDCGLSSWQGRHATEYDA